MNIIYKAGRIIGEICQHEADEWREAAETLLLMPGYKQIILQIAALRATLDGPRLSDAQKASEHFADKLDPSPWMTLRQLRKGAIFTTRDGILAVKSEYHTFVNADGRTQCDCYLVESGESAHFDSGDDEQVREVYVRPSSPCEHQRLNDHRDACLDCGKNYIPGIGWQ